MFVPDCALFVKPKYVGCLVNNALKSVIPLFGVVNDQFPYNVLIIAPICLSYSELAIIPFKFKLFELELNDTDPLHDD